LELVESEDAEGVEIINLDHASPAAKSALRVGDRIVRIDRYRIRNLDDFVKVSKKYKGRKTASSIVYYREGIRRSTDLSLHSPVLRGRWGVKIVPRKKAGIPAGKDAADYWVAEARKRMSVNRKKKKGALTPDDYGTVILSLYTALAENLPENHAMMLTIPFVLYSLFRYLYLVQVKGLGGEPEEIVLRDRPLQAGVALWGVAVVLIMYIFR